MDTSKQPGIALEWWVNLFSTRYNETCDICWFIYGQVNPFIWGLALGALLEKTLN